MTVADNDDKQGNRRIMIGSVGVPMVAALVMAVSVLAGGREIGKLENKINDAIHKLEQIGALQERVGTLEGGIVVLNNRIDSNAETQKAVMDAFKDEFTRTVNRLDRENRRIRRDFEQRLRDR